jgi:hypothetical protein
VQLSTEEATQLGRTFTDLLENDASVLAKGQSDEEEEGDN